MTRESGFTVFERALLALMAAFSLAVAGLVLWWSFAPAPIEKIPQAGIDQPRNGVVLPDGSRAFAPGERLGIIRSYRIERNVPGRIHRWIECRPLGDPAGLGRGYPVLTEEFPTADRLGANHTYVVLIPLPEEMEVPARCLYLSQAEFNLNPIRNAVTVQLSRVEFAVLPPSQIAKLKRAAPPKGGRK